MKYAVEVAHLINGELMSVRRLSARREHRGAWIAVTCVMVASLAAMGSGMLLVRAFGRAIYAPWFVAGWTATVIGCAVMAAGLVRSRLRRYRLGASLDCDAFAPVEADLVSRAGDHFNLTVLPGMEGHIESGRAPLPIEAMAGGAARVISLDDGATAQLILGNSTFVVRSRAIAEKTASSASASASASRRSPGSHRTRDVVKIFSRAVVPAIQLAFVGTFFCAVPRGQTIGDRMAHLVSPRITTPWEAEKWLRIEAQMQSRSLHQCFDALPLTCQHPGYLGVGVSLARDGEVRSNWISRSTYGEGCPVDQCVRDVVATWVFDALPEPMRVVLPVQVLRTDKPFPAEVAQDHRGGAPAVWVSTTSERRLAY